MKIIVKNILKGQSLLGAGNPAIKTITLSKDDSHLFKTEEEYAPYKHDAESLEAMKTVEITYDAAIKTESKNPPKLEPNSDPKNPPKTDPKPKGRGK